MLLQILTSSLKVLFRGYPEKVQLSTVHTCGTELWTNNTDSEGADWRRYVRVWLRLRGNGWICLAARLVSILEDGVF